MQRRDTVSFPGVSVFSECAAFVGLISSTPPSSSLPLISDRQIGSRGERFWLIMGVATVGAREGAAIVLRRRLDAPVEVFSSWSMTPSVSFCASSAVVRDARGLLTSLATPFLRRRGRTGIGDAVGRTDW